MNLVSTSTAANGWVAGAPYQRFNFFAQGLYWCFYTNGTDMGWKVSLDGILWSAFTAIRAATQGYWFSVAFDGVNFHYCYFTNSPGFSLLYRMGQANSDGTITWLAAEQTAVAGVANHYFNDPGIAIDSNGYPWIAYGFTDVATWDTYAWVAKSKTKNGTWTQENVLFASPYQFSASRFNNGSAPSVWCCPVPLTLGKMYVIAQTDGNNAVGGAEKNMKGNLWSGAAWAGEETCVTSNTIGSACLSPVPYGDDVHLTVGIFTAYPTDLTTYHYKRTYGVGWGAGAVVRVHPTNLGKQSVLSIDNSGVLRCFWLDEPVAKHGYYKKYVAGAWDINPTDWFTEVDATQAGGIPCVSDKEYNGRTIFSTPTLTVSPYNYKMIALVASPPSVVSSQVAANLDDITVYSTVGVWTANIAGAQNAGYYNATFIKWGGGMRFTGITIPAGATNIHAHLIFVCTFRFGPPYGGTVRSVIIGEKANNAAQFSTIADYQARRGTIVGGADNTHITAASVIWNIPDAWFTGDTRISPELSSIIQELVTLYGGLAAANIVLFWDDHANNSDNSDYTFRSAYSHDGSAILCPILYIQYDAPVSPIKGGGSLAQKLVSTGLI